MAKSVRKYPFTEALTRVHVESGIAEKSMSPSAMFDVMLPSGAQPVMANIDHQGNFCIWIEGDFDSNPSYWNSRMYAAYFTGARMPGDAVHCGSTVDDRNGLVYHCYDISNWVYHVSR